MSLYEIYLGFHKQECEKYGGESTIVGFQVGNFTEFYGCAESGADVAGICTLLNIVHTRRNKALAISPSNPSMAGFPSTALLTKYLPVLLAAGKTVSLVTQVSGPPHVRREVTRVFSSSTYNPIDFWSEDAPVTSRAGPLVSLFVTKLTPSITVGLASIDISTGDSSATCESGAECATLRAIANAIDVINPSEVLVTVVGAPRMGSKPDTPEMSAYESFLARFITGCGLSHHPGVIIRPTVRRPSTLEQEEILRRAFPSTGMLSASVFTALDSLADEATGAYTAAVQFMHDHDDELIVSRLRPPKLCVGGTCASAVRLSRQALRQLDVTNDTGGSLIDMLGVATQTPAGGRLLRRRLMSPIYEIDTLNQRLDRVSTLASVEMARARKDIQTLLASTGDLERSFRRVSMSAVRPASVAAPSFFTPSWVRNTLATALSAAQQAISLSPWAESDAVKYLEAIRTLLTDNLGVPSLLSSATPSQSQASKHGGEVERPFFIRGLYPEIDVMHDHVQVMDREVCRVVGTLNLMAGGNDHFRATPFVMDGGPCGITSTPLRLASLIKCSHARTIMIKMGGSKVHMEDQIFLPISELYCDTRPTLLLRHPTLDALNHARCMAHEALHAAQDNIWRQFMRGLVETHASHMHEIVDTLSELDTCAAVAEIAVKSHHIRPLFVSGGAGRMEARGLRHPLIEALRHDAHYVSNDLVLDPDGDSRGMLLFGVNASGKSSLMKSVGVAVLMAQAGMFVACDSLTLCPYRSLSTRIGSRDDIRRGHSTFVVEMLELRDILAQTGQYGLVIGDELCSGTETISAHAIVAAAVATLHQERASFVFATHLHDLPVLPVVKALVPPVCVTHLTVRFVDDVLVYDRKLMPGSGQAVYGLEIAKGLDLPRAFLQIADRTRRHLMGVVELTPSKRSTYNSRVGVGACAVCGTTSSPRESHHIRAQATADADGFTGHFHKNRAFNLAVLCTVCHDDVHAGRIKVGGYVDTCENGTILEVSR